jgi:hypothetical protein
MEVSSQKRLSLDTNVLFDLAEGRDYAAEFREAYQRKGYALFISPTVAAEVFFALDHGDQREKKLASICFSKLTVWDIEVASLTATQLKVAHAFAAKIRNWGLVPSGEVNDSCVIGETAMLGIPLVVSSDHHLLDIDDSTLRALCVASELPVVFAVSPRALVRALR